jgi:exodeoxyribonuclease VII small subunit
MSKKEPGAETRKEPSFEEALGRIEEIVERLEQGDLALDESLRLFQEGVDLSRRCQAVLDDAQRKIEQLVRAADGTLRAEPVEEGDA